MHTFECSVDGHVVYRYELVSLEKVKQLIKKVVGVLSNEEEEVMNIFVVENLEAGSKAL